MPLSSPKVSQPRVAINRGNLVYPVELLLPLTHLPYGSRWCIRQKGALLHAYSSLQHQKKWVPKIRLNGDHNFTLEPHLFLTNFRTLRSHRSLPIPLYIPKQDSRICLLCFVACNWGTPHLPLPNLQTSPDCIS